MERYFGSANFNPNDGNRTRYPIPIVSIRRCSTSGCTILSNDVIHRPFIAAVNRPRASLGTSGTKTWITGFDRLD
jgi:hypothetical protein